MSANDRFSTTHTLAVYDRRLTAGEFRILAVLGAHANAGGRCHPQQKSIASMLNITAPTVCSAISKLASCGYLEKIVITIPGRGRSGCEYIVRMDLSDTDLIAAKKNCGNERLRHEPNSALPEFGYERRPTSLQAEVHREESQKKNPSREREARAQSADGETPNPISHDFMPDDAWIKTRSSKVGLDEWEVRTIIAECRDYWRTRTGPAAKKTPRGWLQTINNRLAAVASDERLRAQLRFSEHSSDFRGTENEGSAIKNIEPGGRGLADRYRQSGSGKPAGIVGSAVRLVGSGR